MLFNSLIFLFYFLPITYVIYWRLSGKNKRYVWLTLASYVFYGFWNYKFCGVMLFSTLVSYLAGLGLLNWQDNRRRKVCLVLPIVIDLSLLAFFKYTNFLITTTNQLAQSFNGHIDLPLLNIVLPIGISFYTFHTITYIVDSYKGIIRPTRNFFEFSCYVSLFSQLVAGPIVRFKEIVADLENIDKLDRRTYLDIGWSFFTIGMIEKVLIADTIAQVIDPALSHYQTLGTINTWLCVLGYTYQLFFDFAGYSNMAVGLGYMFGMHIPQNFNSPYKAIDIRDFWTRWHMSLSRFLRDYLYIPIGGSRGSMLSAFRNLMVTMLLGGLWHGASWTFVVWGGYHGSLLVLNRIFQDQWLKLPPLFCKFSVFILVAIGWVFFRSQSFPMAFSILHSMFSWRTSPTIAGTVTLLCMLPIAFVLAQIAPNSFQITHKWRPLPRAALCTLFALCMCLMYSGQVTPFLYFQF